MSWRIIYIEESDTLSLYLDNIKVKRNDDTLLLPLSDLHTIILDNYKINLSVHLINALAKNNINLVSCDVDHLPIAIIMPIHGSYYTPKRLYEQLSWKEDKRSYVHQKIVVNKIRNQLNLIKHISNDKYSIDLLFKYKKEVTLADKTNREGLAAKVYFAAIFGKDFKRFDKDVINAGLNYGYAILRSQISKTLVGKGLNTCLGIFHKGISNSFNLSDDIIEVFRPIIDKWVYDNLMEAEIFKKEHKIELIKQTTKNLYFKGKKQTIFNVISMYVDSILNYFNNGEEIEFPLINYNEL
jgi:CRISPR-associated protein Cas1